MRKYKVIKMPMEAYEKEKRRAEEMTKRLRELTKKSKNIKMTQYMRFRAERLLFVYDDELLNFFTKKKSRSILI